MSKHLESRIEGKPSYKRMTSSTAVLHHPSRMLNPTQINRNTYELRILFLVISTIAFLITSLALLTGGNPFVGIFVFFFTFVQLIVQIARIDRAEEPVARYVSGTKFHADLKEKKTESRQTRVSYNKRSRSHYNHQPLVTSLNSASSLSDKTDSNTVGNDDFYRLSATTIGENVAVGTSSCPATEDEPPPVLYTYDIRNVANGTYPPNTFESSIDICNSVGIGCESLDMPMDDNFTSCDIDTSFDDRW